MLTVSQIERLGKECATPYTFERWRQDGQPLAGPLYERAQRAFDGLRYAATDTACPWCGRACWGFRRHRSDSGAHVIDCDDEPRCLRAGKELAGRCYEILAFSPCHHSPGWGNWVIRHYRKDEYNAALDLEMMECNSSPRFRPAAPPSPYPDRGARTVTIVRAGEGVARG